MSDIFISYSSKDKAKADQLSELLASAGLSVWIDQSALDVATSWSEEIVDAIDSCKAFIVMLSPSSILSHNVVKEVSLASEKRKKILPLDLEPVELPKNLQYALAGIQRTAMTNIDSIIRALGKLGLEATQAPTLKLVRETDSRKSLMILPFEDLSPTGDNRWFTDGMASELISTLSNIKSLRVADFQTTKDYKSFKGRITEWAKELSIRYFIEGQVRKFGDQIKISIALLDIETGDHLWQDSMKGTMDDIFDIQEKVAQKVVEGLKVHLAANEKQKLKERGTVNAEAYELVLKAREYFFRQSKEGFQLASQLSTEAISLDPLYADAYQIKANALVSIYRHYNRDPAILDEAETLCKESLRLNPDSFSVYHPLAQIYMRRGMLAEAEATAREYISKDPQNYNSHFSLAFFFQSIGEHAKAIAPLEKSVQLRPDFLVSMFNLAVACDAGGEKEKAAHWASVALPQFERQLKLYPDNENRLVTHATLLIMSGKNEAAHAAAIGLMSLKDGQSLYNVACILARLGDKAEALTTFRKAIAAGFKDIRHMNEFLTNKDEGIPALVGTPEFVEVKRMVEEIEREAHKNV